MFKSYSYIIFIIIISLIILLFKKIDKNILLFYIASSVSLILILIIGGEPHKYYLIVLLPFIIPFLACVIDHMQSNFKNKAIFVAVTLLCFMVIALATGRNILLTNFSYTEREARKVKEVLNNYIDIDRDKKMLCIGFGPYYYNYFDLLPNQKYFYVLGIPYDDFKEPIDSLYNNINNGKSDIVIYCQHDEIKKSYGNLFDVALSKNYDKILQMSGGKEVYILKKYDK